VGFNRDNVRFGLILMALTAPISACSGNGPSRDDMARINAVFDKLRHGDVTSVEAELTPDLKTSAMDQQLQFMVKLIPPQAPTSTKILGSNITNSPGRSSTGVSTEYDYPDRKLIVTTVLLYKGGADPRVSGIHMNYTIVAVKK
jgi:hypothetical protein